MMTKTDRIVFQASPPDGTPCPLLTWIAGHTGVAYSVVPLAPYEILVIYIESADAK